MDIKGLKAVILAAGKGTRMKSDTPKVLHSILGKTLLERVIDQTFKLENMDEIFVVVGHQSEKVVDLVNNKYSKSQKKVSTVLQSPQLGTGDAVFKAYDKLKNFSGTVMVLCGDTPLLTAETLNNLYNYHTENNCAVTVLSAKFDDPTNYGRIIRNIDGLLQKITEEKDATPDEKLIEEVNAGVYCLEWDKINSAFFELTTNNEQGEYYLTDIIDWAVKKSLKADAYTLDDNNEIFGINSRLHLAEATKILNQKKLNQLMNDGVTIINPDSTMISPETTIGEDSIIYPNTFIEGENNLGSNNIIGPNTFIKGNVKSDDGAKIIQSTVSNAIVGKNSTVGPFAHLRDGVELDENVRVGNFVEIKKSKISSKSNVAHLSYIGDTDMGSEVNVGAGTITANYNALTKEKSKTVINDKVKIGSNTVLVAPVTLAEGANIAAGSVITKDVPAWALGITRATQKIFENWVKNKIDSINK